MRMRVNAITYAIFVAAMLFLATITGQIGVNASRSDQLTDAYWAPVEKAMGVQGDVGEGGAIKFDVPRNLTVTLDGVRLAPGSDMSHEFEFMRVDDKAMMVGEIMVREGEVANVTGRLLDAGLNVTAIHNHLLRESPHIMWLHIHGHGDPVEIAKSLRNITTSLDGAPAPAGETVPISQLDTATMDRAMGREGAAEDGVYAYSIPRAEKIRMSGIELSPIMDISSGISFQPLGSGKSAVIGELVLTADEVEPVLRALAGNGIEVTALHSHMLTEQPRLFYLHCWATGDATEIAKTMRKALDETNNARGN
jgi:hypothetical protein